MADAKYLVGIDIGTTGAKTVVFGPEGNTVASGYREYACTYPKPNWVEEDADMLVTSSMESFVEASGRAISAYYVYVERLESRLRN